MARQSIKYEIGFSDAEVIGYQLSRDLLTVSLRAWNEKTLVFEFSEMASFLDHGAGDIADVVVETDDTELIRVAIRRLFDEAPKSHSFKHYCFIDLDGDACMEVIAESCSISTREG